MRSVRISVCMATFNGAVYLKRQLESILSQLEDCDEIIISDDGSTDDTLQIIESLKSPLIRVIYNKGRHGYTGNFENALNEATGEYVFLSDQDDEWMPGKVEKYLQYLQKYDFVVSDALIVDSDGIETYPSFFSQRRPKSGLLGNLVKFGYLGCCMAFKKKVLVKALPFPTNHVLCSHDNWLMLVSLMYFKTLVTHEKMVKYRRHGLNVSTGGIKGHKSFFFRLKYRCYLLIHLLCRVGYKKC